METGVNLTEEYWKGNELKGMRENGVVEREHRAAIDHSHLVIFFSTVYRAYLGLSSRFRAIS